MQKQRVLFLCIHNSARSQIAEGLLRQLYGDRYEVYSAGTAPTEVDPYAIRVLAEIGVDGARHRSKGIEEFLGMEFDYVVTVCDPVREACPVFPLAKQQLHKSFPDPTAIEGTEGEKLRVFRELRDQLLDWLKATFGE